MKNWHLPSLLHEKLALFGCLEHRNPVNQHLIRKIKDRLPFSFTSVARFQIRFLFNWQSNRSECFLFFQWWILGFLSSSFLAKFCTEAGKKFFHQFLLLIQNHLQFLMEQQGMVSFSSLASKFTAYAVIKLLNFFIPLPMHFLQFLNG